MSKKSSKIILQINTPKGIFEVEKSIRNLVEEEEDIKTQALLAQYEAKEFDKEIELFYQQF